MVLSVTTHFQMFSPNKETRIEVLSNVRTRYLLYRQTEIRTCRAAFSQLKTDAGLDKEGRGCCTRLGLEC